MRTADPSMEDWDYLVILDACRYDYFKILHHRYLEGELERRLSLGTDTWTWCRRALRGSYGDVLYVSANPYINSAVSLRGCRAKDSVREIIDVWSYGWDEELGTVPPWTLAAEAIRLLGRHEGRMIIHFLQPHAPYLSPRYRASGFPRPEPGKTPILRNTRKNIPPMERIIRAGASAMWRLRLLRHHWPLLEALGLPPASPMDAVRRLYGVQGLREAYRENLEITLGYVAVLADRILREKPGAKIVVTSDHGEALGEQGQYGHGFNHPKVRSIPWFRLREVKTVPVEARKRVLASLLQGKLKARKTPVRAENKYS